ncbi:MAG: hypothetical protein IPL46_16785 [Saprospiraceae bacterium]|nr:hypothetical protein [Saprospiraceae bacterium]
MKASTLFIAIVIFSGNLLIAQDHVEESFPTHMIGLDIGHAHLFEQDESGHKGLLSLPSFGLNYTLQINERWGFGVHTDLIFEEYRIVTEVRGDEHESIERVYPIAPAILGIYKLSHHWALLAGFGREFSKGENFWLNRAGIEYSMPLHARWEFFGTLQYDVKWEAYDNWVLGFGLAKYL